MTSSFSFLRNVPMFADLPDEDLEKVCRKVKEIELPQGELLFTEGSVGHDAYVIKEGQIEIYKISNGSTIQLAIRKPGEVIGEISLVEEGPRNASGRAMIDSRLIVISQDLLDHILNTNPSAARIILHTINTRLKSTQLSLNQSEKMALLGTMTAGITHELNNPAAAVRRGAEQLKEIIEQHGQLAVELQSLPLDQAQRQLIDTLAREIKDQALHPPILTPIMRSDRESEWETWLEENEIDEGWQLAPVLTNLLYQPQEMRSRLSRFPDGSLPVIIAWMAARFSLYSLLDEIGQGASQISEIVKAVKSYVYLDEAPIQGVNIQEGIENTLVILRNKLKQGVELLRDYGSDIPQIQAYGSELNQVWTNIIDNAIDAMDGKGQLTIQTRYEEPWVIVDIADTGPGIPPDVQSRLFSPFFTTKPIGKGTGMGLSISYNIINKHGGDIKVTSRPGDTHFTVWLPVDFSRAQPSPLTLSPFQQKDP